MTTPPTVLRCTGRPVNDHGQHIGQECGRTFTRPRGYPVAGTDGPDDTEYLRRARAAGWGVLTLPDGTVSATCPACRRPDPATVAVCRDLTKESTRK